MFVPPAGYPLSAYVPPVTGVIGAPPPILADRIDPATGDLSTILEGDDPTDAAIQWQCTVRQGSGAALGDNGHRFHLITKGIESAPLQLADEGRRIMEKFENRGQVVDVQVLGDVIGGSTATGAVEITYTNTNTTEKSALRAGST